ncbi:MAG: hypothetical protein ACKO8I_12595, partial [Cyanobacteriota bacterium]
HLAARLGRALGLPNLLGCGIDAAGVWELVAQVPPEQPLLVLHERWLSAEALEGMQAQAIVHVESFGSGTTIRALQAQSFLDPRLQEKLEQQARCRLTGREQQTLETLARGAG